MASFFSAGSARSTPVVPLLRLVLAAYLWYPLVVDMLFLRHYQRPETTMAETAVEILKEHAKWLAGWDETFQMYFFRFFFVLWEMRAYISRCSDDDKATRKLAERCLYHCEAFLVVWSLVSLGHYLVAVIQTKAPPAGVPWYLLISNYVVILAVILAAVLGSAVAVACASSVPGLDDADVLVLTRMVLLFPARQLLPWSSLKDILFYVTGQRQLVKNETWLRRKAFSDDEDQSYTKQQSSRYKFFSAARRLSPPIATVALVTVFWGYLVWLWLWKQSSAADKVAETKLQLAALLFVPWFFAAYALALVVDPQTSSADAAATVKVRECLESSGKQSLAISCLLPVVQITLLQMAIMLSGKSMRYVNLQPLYLLLGFLLFVFKLYRSSASRKEWLLAARLMPRLPDSLLLPRLQALSLYNYARGRYHLVPQVMLTDEQKAALRGGRGADEEKQTMLVDEQLKSG